MLRSLAHRIFRLVVLASFIFPAPMLNTAPLPVSAAENPPLAVELTVEPSGGDTLTVGVIVRNKTSSDVDPLWVAASIPGNATVLSSWTGNTNDYPGKLDGQQITWFNSKLPADGIQGPFFFKVSIPRGSSAVFRAQASWQNPSRGTAASPEILSSLLPAAMPGTTVTRVADAADFGLPGGRFYTQTNGQGSAANSGYAVVDGGVDGQGSEIKMYSGYVALGGPGRLGYPVSRRYKEGPDDPYTYQAFQNGALQWDPASKSVRLTNLMDDLHGAGLDALLEKFGYTPWEPDNSAGDYARARAERLEWLNDPSYADFKAAYFNSNLDPETFFGLPASRPRTQGWIRVLRLQRAVFATYNNGPVVMASIGDDAAKAGYISGDVLRPQSTDESDLAAWMFRNSSIRLAASSPLTLKYREDWIGTAANCSDTILRGDLRDVNGNPVNGEIVKTWNDWGNELLQVVGLDRGAGSWERYLGQGPREGVWHVQILHPETRAPLSPVSSVAFMGTCSANSVQEITVHHKAN